MSEYGSLGSSRDASPLTQLLRSIHLDIPLLVGLLTLSGIGLVVLYSASGEDMAMVTRQAIRIAIALLVMVLASQFSPAFIRRWTPALFAGGLILLILVLTTGDIGKGAQRWLDLGFFRFQPSEIMKLAVPMMVAWYLHDRPLPPKFVDLLVLGVFIVLPAVLIGKQPDLGTALLVGSAGAFAVFLAGIRKRLLALILVLLAVTTPLAWKFMLHDYQKRRILTFLNPENDPLASGYHIIQSKIAIGSGGLFGKGWLNGTQSQLEFLPERHTDFIFAVIGEEFGLLGGITVLTIYLFIVGRGLYIATQAEKTFERILAGSLTLTFFVYVFVNIGMVTGLLPVVGVPLPLISYGGTSIVTLMAGFGILMSIGSSRKLKNR